MGGLKLNKVVREKVKEAITLFLIIVTFVCVLAIMLKYENEGEKNIPFRLSEMLVISSADGEIKDENPENYHWNLNINQYNDIYLKINRNEKIQDMSYLESISIDNIKINGKDGKEIYAYMPSNMEDKSFSYDDNFIIDSMLTYKGAEEDNRKKLEVGNQGGTIIFRIANKNVSEYVSNDDGEISYDGTLLKLGGVEENNLKFKVSFDLIITTNNAKYKAKMKLDLPTGNIIEEGVSKLHQTEFNNIIFKRQR